MMRMSLASIFAFAALVLSMPYAGLTQPQNKGRDEYCAIHSINMLTCLAIKP